MVNTSVVTLWCRAMQGPREGNNYTITVAKCMHMYCICINTRISC